MAARDVVQTHKPASFSCEENWSHWHLQENRCNWKTLLSTISSTQINGTCLLTYAESMHVDHAGRRRTVKRNRRPQGREEGEKRECMWHEGRRDTQEWGWQGGRSGEMDEYECRITYTSCLSLPSAGAARLPWHSWCQVCKVRGVKAIIILSGNIIVVIIWEIQK